MSTTTRAIVKRLLSVYFVSIFEAPSASQLRWVQANASAILTPTLTWRESIRDHFGFSPELDDEIRALFSQASIDAERVGQALTVEPFVDMLIEENFQEVLELFP
jgi:hypothetical protein